MPVGAYVESEWAAYGMTLSAAGGFGTLPRIFDSANPGDKESGGDAGLGAPNEKCRPPGPGVGMGGEPEEPGANCSPLGNVLIIQGNTTDTSIPDPSEEGGMILFDFDPKATYVKDMGFLNVDCDIVVTVLYVTETGDMAEKNIRVRVQGGNSYVLIDILTENVVQIVVTMECPGAITSITICVDLPETPTTPPSPTPPPTLIPGSMSMSMDVPGRN